MRKSRFFRDGKAIGHGDVTGGFNSSSLDYTMMRAREAFLGAIQSLQSGTDPKPYLLTIYALSLIGDENVRDKIIADFEESLNELDERYSPAGIVVCVAAWAAISEYLGILGSDKKLTVMGESSDLDEDLIYEQPNPLDKYQKGKGKEEEGFVEDVSIVDFDENEESDEE